MNEDATLMGKPMITMATPWGVSPPHPRATDTHTAPSGVMFNSTKLPSQIEVQTFKKKNLLLGKKVSPNMSILLAFHI